MAIDIEAAFDKVKALIVSVDGMQEVNEGIPDAFGPSISSLIAISPISVLDIATELIEVNITFFVLFGYKVSGAEADAERKLMRGLADFIPKFYAARATDFDGVVVDARLDMSLGGTPEYEMYAGQEYRRYPIQIHVTQQANI